MRSVSTTFLRGLLTTLPLCLTIYAVYWMLAMAESIMVSVLKPLLPKTMVVPTGLGVLVGILVILLLGMAMDVWVVRRIVQWGQQFLSRIPLIKTIYGAINGGGAEFSFSTMRGNIYIRKK